MIVFGDYQKGQSEKGYQFPYFVQLLLETTENLDTERLLESLRTKCDGVELIEKQSGLLAFAHTEKLMRVKEGLVPAQSIFMEPELVERPLELFSSSLAQTWDWPESKDVISKTKAVIGIADAFTDAMNRQERLKLFHNVVLATLNITPPLAIHWLPSQRIVDIDRYKDDLQQGGQLFSSAVNVRMFKVEETDEKIMDTMGLAGLGCPDLQCHFRDVDPRQMGVYLYQLAEYVFERGDVFRDGDTVEGFEPNDQWKIHKQSSFVDPQRRVIHIIPGQYAPNL